MGWEISIPCLFCFSDFGMERKYLNDCGPMDAKFCMNPTAVGLIQSIWKWVYGIWRGSSPKPPTLLISPNLDVNLTTEREQVKLSERGAEVRA